MGTYYLLFFAGYPVFSLKSDVEPVVMTIFRENDKRIFKRKISERNHLGWEHTKDDGETEIAYEYSNTVAHVKQRLKIMGFTLNQAEKAFNELVAEDNENAKAHKANLGWPFHDVIAEDNENAKAHKANLGWPFHDVIEGASFTAWLQAFKTIFEKKLTWNSTTDNEHPLVQRIMKEGGPEDCFLCKDLRSFFRAFIEVCPDHESVTLDITDLVEGGYYPPNYALCDAALEQLAEEHAGVDKIIVLAEGSTDKVVSEKSLLVLYPHLSNYYSFIAFGLSNSAGGASALVTTVKAFIGSGIKNRIIALFDNDTAAQSARRSFSKIQLPSNIRIVECPDIEIAKSYPTVGPSGISHSNINGAACSIELYFGTDILVRDEHLTPIHWKGYDASLNQYQGEILNKKDLQVAFLEKVAKCESDPNLIDEMDWASMRLVLETLFEAFI